MTPGARLQAVIELLDDVTAGGAADAAASAYFRSRRYIGSKDRSFIAESLFRMLRRVARLDWWINRTLERPENAPPPPGRFRVVAEQVIELGWKADDFAYHFDGSQHRRTAAGREFAGAAP